MASIFGKARHSTMRLVHHLDQHETHVVKRATVQQFAGQLWQKKKTEVKDQKPGSPKPKITAPTSLQKRLIQKEATNPDL